MSHAHFWDSWSMAFNGMVSFLDSGARSRLIDHEGSRVFVSTILDPST